MPLHLRCVYHVSAISVVAMSLWTTGCANMPPTTGPTAPTELLAGAARLAFTDMEGVRHDLDALLEGGTNVTLVFWQTWCASCLREAPELAEAARTLNGRMPFFGVISGPEGAVDDEKVREVVRKFATPYPQIRDRDLHLTRYCDVRGTPTLLVLGRGRRVLYTGHRPPADWTALTSAR
ncbi:MAG: TlpA family protein disulfide reductase [Planctomycetota bacterium]